MKHCNLCLLGFGNVNRTLVELLQLKSGELQERYAITWKITGVASRRIGWLADLAGFDPTELLNGTFAQRSRASAPKRCADVSAWLREAHADVLFEATSLLVEDGQPAIDHIRAALEHGAHAITANKGPVVHGYRTLLELAKRKGRRFLFESAVMDGVPIFSLFPAALPALEIRGFSGILNSTTNVILTGMEEGLNFEASLKRARELGIAETDASYDIDGWDAAVKVAALATVIMGMPLPPQRVTRTGIRELTAEEVRSARQSGTPYKLVCHAHRTTTGIEGSVTPQRLPLSDPMALVSGTSSIIRFETDIFPGLTIIEENPGLYATAYGMLADLIRAANG